MRIETFLKNCRNDYNENEIPESVQRIFDATKNFKNECRYFHVESTYYDWALEERAQRMSAPSIDHLCKSLLFINKNWKERSANDHPNFDMEHPQYVLVVVQYTDKISNKKLCSYLRERAGNVQGLKKFNMRIAPEDIAFKFTGYGKNSVTPFGMKEPIPVLITKKITELEPPILYLGSGHIDWKIACPVARLLDSPLASSVDLSE